MMDNILDETKSFVSKIKGTTEYSAFITARNNLELKPELIEGVDAFRRESFAIQMSHNYGEYNSFEQLLHLKKEHEDLLSSPLVKRFLDTELKLTKIIAAVYQCIAEEIDFDIDFLLH